MKATILLPDSTTIERAVHNIRPNIPNLFGYEDYLDASGVISLNGKETLVETCYREGVVVWRVKSEREIKS